MKKYANEDIKSLMKHKKISQYDLSLKLGVSDTTVFRMLRRELTQDEKERIMNLINEMEG